MYKNTVLWEKSFLACVGLGSETGFIIDKDESIKQGKCHNWGEFFGVSKQMLP